VVPFYAEHQAGITTPQQEVMYAAAFDVTAGRRSELRDLLRAWSAAAARMTEGLPSASLSNRASRPPEDSGEALGLSPARLTVTFGFGPTLFLVRGNDRFGLATSKPSALAQVSPMPGDALDPALSGGDLFVQACADDLQVCFHALRTLIRIGEGAVKVRWRQLGFGRTARTSRGQQTPRNLQGFKDGTDNILLEDRAALDKFVWLGAPDLPAWARGGTYVVTRRIRMAIEAWDRTSLGEQERTIGRHKLSGAPFGGRHEHDPVHLTKLPSGSHVSVSHPDSNNGVRILRRGFSFSDGVDARSGQLDAGLFFICYQRDPGQFDLIQERLAAEDRLNPFISHVGSAVFLCPPGASRGGYVGETLLG
jgi:deferrochelatase/peroxidase EfeB